MYLKRCCKVSSFLSKLRMWKTVCTKYVSTKDCITDMLYVLPIKTYIVLNYGFDETYVITGQEKNLLKKHLQNILDRRKVIIWEENQNQTPTTDS